MHNVTDSTDHPTHAVGYASVGNEYEYSYYMTILTSTFLLDPRQQIDNIGVDSGGVWLCTAVSEADNAILQPRVTLLADQWTTRVALARVLATFPGSGTQHVVRQRAVSLPTNLVRNDW